MKKKSQVVEIKTSKVSVPDAVIRRWWWRDLVFVDFDITTHTTRWRPYPPEQPDYPFSAEWSMWQKDEITIFRYEFLRRICAFDLPEWHQLPGLLESCFAGALRPKAQRCVLALFSPKAPSFYASFSNWSWDLKASDEALCKHFLQEINKERRKAGLPDTGDPFYRVKQKKRSVEEQRRGRRKRPVSWMAVEAYDLQRHKIRPLTDSERSRLSKAKREMGHLKEKFQQALQHASELCDHLETSNQSLYSRFLRKTGAAPESITP